MTTARHLDRDTVTAPPRIAAITSGAGSAAAMTGHAAVALAWRWRCAASSARPTAQNRTAPRPSPGAPVYERRCVNELNNEPERRACWCRALVTPETGTPSNRVPAVCAMRRRRGSAGRSRYYRRNLPAAAKALATACRDTAPTEHPQPRLAGSRLRADACATPAIRVRPLVEARLRPGVPHMAPQIWGWMDEQRPPPFLFRPLRH